MIIDPAGKQNPTTSNLGDSSDQLLLNPGAPERKPRSAGKFCLWLTIIVVCLVGGTAVYFFISNVLYQIRHPHNQMYYDKSEGDIADWSTVVQPMIGKKDTFDIIASVWVRDEDGGDGGIYVDGEERKEKLIYTGTVFQNLSMKSKPEFKNVQLRVPMKHLAQSNISNYDLRASFVLVQPYRPSWIAQKFMSWKPEYFHSPALRPHSEQPTLEDKIYDSFGFTIPLIQFHNISSRYLDGSGNTTRTPLPEADENEDWDEEADLLTGEEEENSTDQKVDDMLDVFRLDFTGDHKPVNQKHPYIASRTHLNIVDETNLYKRVSYMLAQKELAKKTCNNLAEPEWHQCKRWYYENGVFETRVQIAGRHGVQSAQAKKNKNKDLEYLYAPHLGAVKRSAGPKDLIQVPIDRETLAKDPTSTPPTPVDEYVDFVWKLSFRASSPGKHVFEALVGGAPSNKPNMTASENELAYVQYNHDSMLGLLGYRADESAHPRRAHLLSFISLFIRAICWLLTVHYWYTRTSTTGISRLGAALMAFYLLMDANEDMISGVFNPKGKGHWLSRIPLSYIFLLIPPFVMLKAVSRLEFGSSGRGGEKKRHCTPRVYFAQATHWERASERIETRVSKRTKFLFLISLFGLAHLFAGPYSYIVTPRVAPPPPVDHPLHSLSDHVPMILQQVYSLGLTFELGGTILQFAMNRHSRTYAGKYKLAAILMLLANALLFLDMLPHVVGTSVRIRGVFVRDMLGLAVSAVDFAQAVRYRSVKTSDTDGTVD